MTSFPDIQVSRDSSWKLVQRSMWVKYGCARDLWSRDRDETLVGLETVSTPRRRDRDHIPGEWVYNLYVTDKPFWFFSYILPNLPLYTASQKIVPTYSCQYLYEILTDFEVVCFFSTHSVDMCVIFFTDHLCFAVSKRTSSTMLGVFWCTDTGWQNGAVFWPSKDLWFTTAETVRPRRTINYTKVVALTFRRAMSILSSLIKSWCVRVKAVNTVITCHNYVGKLG